MPFFTYNQNNSSGVYVINNKVAHYVIIEADTAIDADNKAEEVGLYFDGWCDCTCCGHRWSPQEFIADVFEVPSIHDEEAHKYFENPNWYASDKKAIIYYKNGDIEKLERKSS